MSISFEETVLPHYKTLYRRAMKLTHDKWDAEDLLQDTLLKAFRLFHRFQEGTNIKAWLFKMMTNLYISRYNRRKRSPIKIHLESLKEKHLHNLLAKNPLIKKQNTEDEILSEVINWGIEKAMLKLSYGTKMAIILAYIKNLKYKEIAIALNCSEDAIRSRIHRGKETLKRLLSNYKKRR